MVDRELVRLIRAKNRRIPSGVEWNGHLRNERKFNLTEDEAIAKLYTFIEQKGGRVHTDEQVRELIEAAADFRKSTFALHASMLDVVVSALSAVDAGFFGLARHILSELKDMMEEHIHGATVSGNDRTLGNSSRPAESGGGDVPRDGGTPDGSNTDGVR